MSTNTIDAENSSKPEPEQDSPRRAQRPSGIRRTIPASRSIELTRRPLMRDTANRGLYGTRSARSIRW